MCLQVVVTRANAKQRRGRAGRVREGAAEKTLFEPMSNVLCVPCAVMSNCKESYMYSLHTPFYSPVEWRLRGWHDDAMCHST